MASSLLASLSLANIVERSSRQQTLRISARFMAHAERLGAEYAAFGLHADALSVLEAALRAWGDYRHDAALGARFLLQILADRDQLGALCPVFPALERLQAAA